MHLIEYPLKDTVPTKKIFCFMKAFVISEQTSKDT